MNRIVMTTALLLIAGTARATTWAPTEKTDPLTGEKVAAWAIMSYGSYIYSWPSKYDLVFWPLTDEKWICFNPKNGYGAFNDDFEKVPDEKKKTLTEWLAKNYNSSQAPKSHKEKLAWLERVYRQRKMDDSFWCRFYRLMAHIHREDQKTSMKYVKKTIPLLETNLKANPKGIGKIEQLFLLGEYYRRSGEAEKAAKYFAEVKTTKYKDRDGKEQVGHPYFIGLIQEREKPPKEESSKRSKPDDGE